MIKKFKAVAFKSLEAVEFELGRVNVFIGANGSGKSNLLEAVGILSAAVSGRVDDNAFLRRGVRPGLPELYKSSFKGMRQPSEIRFEATSDEGAAYAVSLINPTGQPEPAWRYKSELLTVREKKIVGRGPNQKIRLDPLSGYTALKAVEFSDGSPEAKLFDVLRDFAIFSPDTPTLRGLTVDTQTRSPVGLSGGGLAEAVKDILNKASKICIQEEMREEVLEDLHSLIGWTKAMGASAPSVVPISRNIPQPTTILRFTDKFMADGRNRLSGYDASEGALYVLFMTVLVHHIQSPPLFAVDNFDHALNPRLAKALTKTICDWALLKEDRQMLLTSHNPLVLDGLPLRNDAIRLFTVERSSRGKTIVKRVQVDERLLDQAEKGIPLSQQWVMGTFGGVPGDI
jgi:predicted ATPase